MFDPNMMPPGGGPPPPMGGPPMQDPNQPPPPSGGNAVSGDLQSMIARDPLGLLQIILTILRGQGDPSMGGPPGMGGGSPGGPQG